MRSVLNRIVGRLVAYVHSVGPATLAFAAAALVLASGAGFLASTALGTSNAVPSRTVTVNVAAQGTPGDTGPQGPAGPAGPQGATGPVGPAGGVNCDEGFTYGLIVFNTPGGHVTIATCIQD